MSERRRYAAPDLGRARERLRADADALASRGLRPTWMVWVPGRPRWLFRRRRGELVVQFEPVLGAAGSPLPQILNPLLFRLREVATLQREAIGSLAVLAREATPRGEHPGWRDELALRCRRLERSTREIELELKRLESWMER